MVILPFHWTGKRTGVSPWHIQPPYKSVTQVGRRYYILIYFLARSCVCVHKCIIYAAGLVRFIVSVLGVVLATVIGVIHTYIKSYTVVWRASGVLMIINYIIILFKLERWRNRIGIHTHNIIYQHVWVLIYRTYYYTTANTTAIHQ